MVSTDLAAKVPLAVRILLGTNVHGVGFSVSYQRVAEVVWFPARFGGEFKLNALFFHRRSISINVKNGDFKRTDVNSRRGIRQNSVIALVNAQPALDSAELVRQHQRMVFSLARRFLRDRGLAEEVAQEVFLSLHRNMGSIQSPAHAAA